MTDFTQILNADLAPGKPVTTELLLAYRDNLAAFGEGAANAPRLQADAIAGEDDFLINVAASNDHEITHGLDIVTGQTVNSTETYVAAYTITNISFTGSIRFKININRANGGDWDLRIKKTSNAVTTILQTWGGDGAETRTIDVPIAAGDVITWEHRRDGGLSTSTTVISGLSQTGDAFLEDRPVYREAT